MKFSLSWLKDFVDFTVPAEDVAAVLTSVGIEVASLVKRHIPAGVKVAKVLSVDKHPNADKLHVCTVDAGESAPLTIVCGAPNAAVGMLAPLATVGTKFENGPTIARAKLRGVESSGMLCSERELGLSEDHSGLMSLSADMKVGAELSEYYPDDHIFEIELTPNRGDCLSILGVAREVAAKLGPSVKNAALSPLESPGPGVDKFMSVAIEAPAECPRYCGRLVKGVRIAPSPPWMAQRLSDAGVRPINNVVDITNYIMLHFGQPMHAFDYAAIAGHKIIVRKAGAAVSFTTLDQTARSLSSSDLLICDGERPVALAGTMGGAGSEISDSTTDVFLECAYFSPSGIRTTSKRLGLSTESSYRFERGVDPEHALVWSVDTAAEMLRLYAAGSVVPGRVDVYPAPVKRPTIRLRPSRVKLLLGVGIPKAAIASTLSSLQFECGDAGEDALDCRAPAFRHDISVEADLIEEVGRFHGYDNIPSAQSAAVSLACAPSTVETCIDAIRASLAYAGLSEIVTNSLTSEKKNRMLSPSAAPLALLNPLSPDMAQLRTTMLGSSLEVLAYNVNRKNLDNRYFDIGRTYRAVAGETLPLERDVLAVVLGGDFFAKTWNNTAGVKSDFYIVKGLLDKLGADIGCGPFVYGPAPCDHAFFDAQSCTVSCGRGISGAMGAVREDICAAFDIKEPVQCAELDITDFLSAQLPPVTYRQLPKYPALERDFCFVLAETVRASE
ncbi:MAG TPA: phenylalanine--tRNA ligase subunit beta, partial [Chitinivibrionales bacterium]|nr:phenylalanine--tRNA ligase subunit beta [Chitinivibrionales bacterium]